MLAPIQALDCIARHYGRGIELDHGLGAFIRAFDRGRYPTLLSAP
jgi:hypothetical protein